MSPAKQAKLRKRRNRRPFVITYPTLHGNGFISTVEHLYIHPKSKRKDIVRAIRDLKDKTVKVHITEVWD